MTLINLQLTEVTPVQVQLQVISPIQLGAEFDTPIVESDPLFSLWLAGDPRLSNWEVDGANGLKPKDGKTVDGDYISGTIYGGLFQP